MKAVICLGGGIASGKTIVAQALAERFPSVAIRSFGNVVRHRARRQGKTLDRATLQTVGLSLAEAGWQSFVDALLEGVPQSVSILSSRNEITSPLGSIADPVTCNDAYFGGFVVLFRLLIVEGIRHQEAVEELRRRHLSDRFLSVYIKVESAVQEKRLLERGESPAGRGHAVESSLPEVEARADLVIDGALPLAEIEGRILDLL